MSSILVRRTRLKRQPTITALNFPMASQWSSKANQAIDHPFIVYSYGDGACPHDDVEFDSLRTAISYASQLHSGAIDPDYLRVEYTHDEYETLCWRDFYQAAHGNIEYASRLVDQCNGGFREGFGRMPAQPKTSLKAKSSISTTATSSRMRTDRIQRKSPQKGFGMNSAMPA